MSIVIRAVLPRTERGNDPNDNRDDPGYLARAQPRSRNSDPFGWAGDFELTDAEVETIAEPRWAYENLLIQGHYLLLCAAPNHGKTTIMLYVSGCLAEAGYSVLYINADVAGADSKAMHQYGKKHGFRMLFPDMKTGKDVAGVMQKLSEVAASDCTLSDYVIIIDTLKKVTSLMDKKAQGVLYGLIRKLTAKGLTICINSHTNKYNAADGKPIYEGTNDVRSDCDELIYLVAEKDPVTKELTVSTIPDKVRGSFRPITFRIDADRNVSRADQYVDVLTTSRQRIQYDKDAERIAIIEDALCLGPKSQVEVVEAVKAQMNHKTARRLLREYGSADSYRQHWQSERLSERNAWRYMLCCQQDG